MKGLDTNVIVRFLVRDNEQQWQIANQYVEKALQENEPCLINNIFFCEVAWVLRSRYKLSRKNIKY